MKKYLIASVIAILVFHAAGIAFSFYPLIPWVDIPLHLLGGAWLGFLFFYLFEERWKKWDSKNAGFLPTLVISVGFVTLVGVFWEFHQYLIDVFLVMKYPILGPQLRDVADTLKDILNDIIGGTVAANIWYFYLLRNK